MNKRQAVFLWLFWMAGISAIYGFDLASPAIAGTLMGAATAMIIVFTLPQSPHA